MYETVFIGIGLIAAFHTLTYARWMKQNGNKIGAYIVFGLLMLGMSIPFYRIFMTE